MLALATPLQPTLLKARSLITQALMALWLGLLLVPTGLAYADTQLRQSLEAFVYDAVAEQHPEALASTIELQLPGAELPHCRQPEPFFPRANETLSGQVTVGLRCSNDRQVRYLRAHIELYGEYPVLTRDISRGEEISTTDLTLVEGNISDLPHQSLLAKAEIAGQAARRHLQAGEPVQAYEVQAVRVINRGDRVQIAVAGAGFEISRQGEAMDHGSLGAQIRIRLPNREVIEAIVTGPGEARVKTGAN